MANLFDGPTYDPALDEVRLKGQILDVFKYLKEWGWTTVWSISVNTGHPENSVSAQIRNLRKVKHGAWEIERRRVGNKFKFRLTGNHVPPETKLSLNAQLRQQIADLERKLAKCHGQGWISGRGG